MRGVQDEDDQDFSRCGCFANFISKVTVVSICFQVTSLLKSDEVKYISKSFP